MHLSRSAILACGLFASCAVQARIVSPVDDTELTYGQLADELARADVVVLGETHRTPPAHEAHLRILKLLHERNDDLVISMEMFERDVQSAVWQYVMGDIGEDEFLEKSRPWPGYATDYRPVIEFAREHQLMVLAANAPRAMAQRVAKEGDAALRELVGTSMYVARSTTAPEDEYWNVFQDQMKGHGELDAASMRRYYQAQCLKDDTMAQTIADEITELRDMGRTPLVVHFCGRTHSDFRLGTVARLEERMPGLDIRVLSTEEVPEELAGTFLSSPRKADFVLLIPEQEREPGTVVATVPARPAERGGRAEKSESGEPGEHGERAEKRERGEHGLRERGERAGESPHGEGRPGLGFMPVYESAVDGCEVGMLSDGGPAEQAGIREGDVITELGGIEVFDVRSYSEALGQLRVGQKTKVKLLRGGKPVELDVTVGRSFR